MKKFLTLFLCLLAIYCGYVLLDSFVIVRKLETVSEPQPASSAPLVNESAATAQGAAEAVPLDASAPTDEVSPVVGERSYEDERVSILITEERLADTTVYVADIRLSGADLLNTALADNSYGRNVTAKTSAIAQAAGAILAINGDFYGSRQSGYVIRNGVLYRSTANNSAEDLVIGADGSFSIIRESDVSAEELLDNGAWQVFSFGPALIENGEISVSLGEEVDRAKRSNPRTAIAIIDELHYLFVVSDGRTEESAGLSLYELAAFLQSKGVQTAYNLDGGGSSTMVFMGELVNQPTGGKGNQERSVSDIVYIG